MQRGLTWAGALLALATVVPLVRRQDWWVRIFDFPRLQIAAGLLGVGVAHARVARPSTGAQAFRALVGLSFLVQVGHMLPYTPLARVQVQRSRHKQPPAGIRLLFANVLQTNRDAPRLLALIKRADPDVILALETDAWWERALSSLSRTHRHTVLRPQENTYGMLLYSRLEFIEPQVRFLIEEDVPSIHVTIRLASGCEVRLHCLHPRPPAPGESASSRERDAELLLVGKAIKEDPCPVIVMGDMNDVAWSHTSDLFRDVSGLLDPRVGRGVYNTFNAKHWFVRFPLDHFFHSNDFRLVDFKRLEAFGSDHFPVYIHLSHEPEAQNEQPEPETTAAEQAEARKKLGEAGAG